MPAADTKALRVLVGARIMDRLDGREYQFLAGSVGVTPQAVGMWARGERLPDVKYWNLIAMALNCSIDYLLGRTEDPHGTVGLQLDPRWEATIRQAKDAGVTPEEVDAAIEFLRKMQKQEG